MKVELRNKEYNIISNEEARLYYSADADALEILESEPTLIAVLYPDKESGLIESNIMEKRCNPANIDIWDYDDIFNIPEEFIII